MVEEVDEKAIRQYLLGEMAEAEMSRFEERLMGDDDLFETLLVIEDELIDERAGGELSAEERARFDAYFLTTPQRRERLQLALTLYQYAARHVEPNPVVTPQGGAVDKRPDVTRSEAASEPVKKDFSSTERDPRLSGWTPGAYLRLAAAAIILIAVGLGIWQWMRSSRLSEVSKGLQALNRAYREQRPTEARSSGLNYAPAPPVTRGSEQEKVDYVARDRAERILLDAVADHPDAPSYHALGQLYLAEQKFDEAIKQFGEALKRRANDAQLESDLGAAYLEKGKASRSAENSGKRLEDFDESLKHLNRAIELDDTLLPARFNRALLYGYLNRLQEAQAEWRSYLGKEPDARWVEEADRHLKSLEK